MTGASDEHKVQADLAAALGGLDLPPVPPHLTQRLLDAFRNILPTVPAELIRDSRGEHDLVGARGGLASAWTMSFRAEPWDVVLDLVPQGRVLALTGQLLGPEVGEGAWIRAFRDDELVGVTITDEHGQFDLGVVSPDVYSLVALTSDQLIELIVDLGSGDGP